MCEYVCKVCKVVRQLRALLQCVHCQWEVRDLTGAGVQTGRTKQLRGLQPLRASAVGICWIMKHWLACWCCCSSTSRGSTQAVCIAFSATCATTRRLERGSSARCFPCFSTSPTECSPSCRPLHNFRLAWRKSLWSQLSLQAQTAPTLSLHPATTSRRGWTSISVLLLALRLVFSTCSVVPNVPVATRHLADFRHLPAHQTYQFILRHHHSSVDTSSTL